MSINAGVWIDHRQAVVVKISKNEEVIQTIESHVERPFSTAGGPHSKHPDRPEGHVPEDKQDRKYLIELNTYYDAVLASLKEVDSLLILGPGEAKGEFRKRIQSQKPLLQVNEILTADKMTDPQIAASVRQHFSKKPVV